MTRALPFGSSGIFRPSRSRGQCFLRDSNVIERIVRVVAPLEKQSFLEIGAGTGELTSYLAREGPRIVAIETDRLVVNQLMTNMLPFRNTVRVVYGDVLKTEFEELLKPLGANRVRVVGNLPYSIASPILLRLLLENDYFSDLTLMFQEEVAERIVAGPGTKSYGFLSVIAQQAATAELVFRISPEAFRPRPRVRSALVAFQLKHSKASRIGDPAFFRFLVRSLMSHRRKTLSNNIKRIQSLVVGPKLIHEALEELEISEDLRAEALSVEDFTAISRFCTSRLSEFSDNIKVESQH